MHVADLPCALPIAAIPDDMDPTVVAMEFAPKLNSLQQSHFTDDAIWRDTFALTRTMRTIYSGTAVSEAWYATTNREQATKFEVATKSAHLMKVGHSSWIDVSFTFETSATPATTCSGFLSLVPTSKECGEWKIWVLRTILENLQGYGNVDKLEPSVGWPNASCSSERKNERVNSAGLHYDCIVVGGGQAGLSVAGRLQALGVSYVVLEKNKEVGDSWGKRYDSARLHTIRECAHLPFERTFTAEYQEFLTKDDLARGYKDWASKFGINILLGAELRSGTWDVTSQLWTLKFLQNHKERVLTSSYVVFAVGAGGQIPLMPIYDDREEYEGEVLHSGKYDNAVKWTGKHAIVVGTANTDVIPVEYIMKGAKALYNESVPTEFADRVSNSNPIAVARLLSNETHNAMAVKEPERFDALERAGFKVDPFGDMIDHIYERLGGHYVDVGASAKISQGLIKVKSDALPVRYTKDGLAFANGDEVIADVVIFATGFLRKMRGVLKDYFGPEIADQVDDYWGLDEEGEVKGVFKPSGHPGFFYLGGTQSMARYYSRFIALQIKATLVGTPLKVYNGGKYGLLPN